MRASSAGAFPTAGFANGDLDRSTDAGGHRRGRPRGARTQVIRQEHCLGRPQVAFLRACFQGLDPRVAWVRYLGRDAAGLDLRHIESQRRRLLAAVVRVARAARASLPPDRRVEEALHVLEGAQAAQAVRALPSLADWVEEQQIDVDMYGESELLELFREHFGLDTVADDVMPAALSSGDPVRALNALESLLLAPPRPGDPCSLWFSPRLAAGFRALGIASLDAALAHIRQTGEAWFHSMWAVGAVQARQVHTWLETQSVHWQRGSTTSALPIGAASDKVSSSRVDLATEAAAGSAWHGGWAMAHMEVERMTRWLDALGIAAGTRALYRRELERFVWWCSIERRQSFLDLADTALHDYAHFLAAIPQRWSCRQPVARHDPRWRPFRGSLDQGARRLAIRVVARFLGWEPPAVSTATAPRRSLNWDAVQVSRAAESLKESRRARRLRALLAVWLEGGVTFRHLAELRMPLDGGAHPDGTNDEVRVHAGDAATTGGEGPAGLHANSHVGPHAKAHLSAHARALCHAHRLDVLAQPVGWREASVAFASGHIVGQPCPVILRFGRAGRPSREDSRSQDLSVAACLSGPTPASLGRVVTRFLRRLARQHNMEAPDQPLDTRVTGARWRSGLRRSV